MGIKEDFLGRERIRSVRDNIHARLTISDRKIGEAKRTGEEFLASFSSYLSENTSGILAPINPGPDQLLLAKSFASPDLLTHPKISHKTTYANSEPKIETTFAGRLDALPLALAYLQFTSLIPINGGFPESVNMNGAIGSLRDFQKEKYLFIPAVTFAFSPKG